ncbi:type II toxin-antitoxin system prevent-host-death family antitoxin [Aphanothece sacrum]|uniref:Antitoxin PHD n=1 Tax=Aphanothece sacrum FPU1 TaxID=1920663 RepID=A0A401IK23_APHSA|nr:type II toxin-antitoxin system prevent-host-death family antitoxin [Aphanothece sacrum]GBF81627.1 antitoxin PHD [Aphanothece sacrum FPU1]GBF84115.1 antitoxin PHD [Aphanothece sacrum FPU3]
MGKVNGTVNADELLDLVKKAEIEGERIIIEKEGKGQVAIINYADLQYLEALEDARDSELLRQAVAESNGEFYTLEEMLAEKGLTLEDIAREDYE